MTHTHKPFPVKGSGGRRGMGAASGPADQPRLSLFALGVQQAASLWARSNPGPHPRSQNNVSLLERQGNLAGEDASLDLVCSPGGRVASSQSNADMAKSIQAIMCLSYQCGALLDQTPVGRRLRLLAPCTA